MTEAWKIKGLDDAFAAGYTPEDLIAKAILADVYLGHLDSANFADCAEGSWTPPVSLEGVKVPQFPRNTLPEALRWYVEELSRSTQTPLILASSVALGAASIALAKQVKVEPRPGWEEPLVLWFLNLLMSGERKTAVMNALRRPLDDWERTRRRELGHQIAEAESRREILTKRLKEAEKEATKDGVDAAAAAGRAMGLARDLADHEVPSLPQLTTSDTTQEAVAILCQENDGRIGIWSDEGETVRNIAGRYSKDQGPSVELYLKGYSGGYYSSSRVGREGISLQDPAIPMVLAIQPEVIRGISNQRALHGQGFFARYQYAVPPSALGSRESRPEPADDRAREAYDNLIKDLLGMPLPEDEYGEISLHVLEFSEAADKLLEDLQDWVEPQLGPSGEMHWFREWGSKFAGQVVRIAGILHVADRVAAGDEEPWATPVERPTLKRAIEIGLCYLQHSRAALGEMGADPLVARARHILEVLKKDNVARISKRDLFDKVHKDSRFKTVKDLDPVLDLLKDHGYVRELKPKRRGPGRPRSIVLEINPLPATTLPHNPQYSTSTSVKPFFEWLEERRDPEEPPPSPEPIDPEPTNPSSDPEVSSPTSAPDTYDEGPGIEDADGASEAPNPNGHASSTEVMYPVCETEGAKEYGLITDPDTLLELARSVEAAEEVALDTETYPRDETNASLDPRRGQVRLLQVATEEVAAVVDVRLVDPGPLLEALQGKLLIAHNGKFDLSFMKNQFGYEHDGPVFDTQVVEAVLYYAAGPRKEKPGWKGFPKSEVRRRSLQDVAADYLKASLSKEERTSDFGQDELSEKQIDYALKDAEILLPLKEELMKKVKALGLERTVEQELRVTPALAYCEDNGFALDTTGWREQAQRAKEEESRLKAECDGLAPPLPEDTKWIEWGWNSSSHHKVGRALEELGARVERNPKTGNYKTGEEELKKINSPPEAVCLVEKILHYRQAAKYASTWGLGWFDKPKKPPRGKKFDKSHQFVVNGRAHTSFNQVVKTGRMSSGQPNLQNIPPDLRKYFIAPPRRKLLIADYKQIELVTAAVVCKEEKLLEVFRRDDDVHALTAREILESDTSRMGRPVTDEEVQAFRPKAKMVSFGIAYGITAKGLAWRIESKFGVPTTREDAQGMIDRFLDTYPALKRWYLEERRKADRCDDVTYTLVGRRRLLDISKGHYGTWRANPSLRLNTPIQGSAGDGFKYAAALLWERRRECPGNPKAVNLIHDEVVLEIDSKHVEFGKEWLEKNMLEGMREVLGSETPISVEITVADNWAAKQ